MAHKNLPPDVGLLPVTTPENFDTYFKNNYGFPLEKDLFEYFEENLEKLLNRGKVLDIDYLLKLDDWLEKVNENSIERFKREFLYVQIIKNFEYINEQILERLNGEIEAKTPVNPEGINLVVPNPVSDRFKLGSSFETEKIKSYQFMSKEWLEGINQNAVYKAIVKFNINSERENEFNYIYSFSLKLAKMFDLSVEKAGCFISNYLLMFAKYINKNQGQKENESSKVSICTECNMIKPIHIRLTFKPVPSIKARICQDCLLTFDTSKNPFDWDLWTNKAEFSRKKSRGEIKNNFVIK
jgi:hypothetical protein